MRLTTRAYNMVRRTPVVGPIGLFAYGAYRGWQMRRDLARSFAPPSHALLPSDQYPEPTLAAPVSQLCTAGQFIDPRYARWCRQMRTPPRLGRKQWEFVYILEVLSQHGMLEPGRLGLGFGCGREPLVATIAKAGPGVLATDLDTAEAQAKGWVGSDQHTDNLQVLNSAGICPPGRFAERVGFEFCDMNAIPAKYEGRFDFLWSACSLEHLGSLRHGLDFMLNAMACLKPGGVAVHTTEFNLSSNDETMEEPGCSVYRRRDLEAFAAEAAQRGFVVSPLNFNAGHLPVDNHIDLPPYATSPHLKLQLGQYVVTSVGLTIQRPN